MSEIKRGSEEPAQSIECAVVIGYSIGLKYILGVGSQAMSNIAGKFVGKELYLYFRRERNIETLKDVEDVLSVFADLRLEESGEGVVAEIANCKICPKKVAKYEFEGTACPWGGILAGFLEEAFGKKLKMTINLKPGETCVITLR